MALVGVTKELECLPANAVLALGCLQRDWEFKFANGRLVSAIPNSGSVRLAKGVAANFIVCRPHGTKSLALFGVQSGLKMCGGGLETIDKVGNCGRVLGVEYKDIILAIVQLALILISHHRRIGHEQWQLALITNNTKIGNSEVLMLAVLALELDEAAIHDMIIRAVVLCRRGHGKFDGSALARSQLDGLFVELDGGSGISLIIDVCDRLAKDVRILVVRLNGNADIVADLV